MTTHLPYDSADFSVTGLKPVTRSSTGSKLLDSFKSHVIESETSTLLTNAMGTSLGLHWVEIPALNQINLTPTQTSPTETKTTKNGDYNNREAARETDKETARKTTREQALSRLSRILETDRQITRKV